MCWIFLLNQKSEIAVVFWKFKARVEDESACLIQTIRSDNSKEYTSETFNRFCQEAIIKHQLTEPYTPQHNGVCERRNRFIMELTRCILPENNLPKRFWGEAANIVVYLQNRISTKAVNDLTPFEACMLEESEDERQDALVDDAPVRGTRLLSDIYQRCNAAFCEPTGFHEAKKTINIGWLQCRRSFRRSRKKT